MVQPSAKPQHVGATQMPKSKNPVLKRRPLLVVSHRVDPDGVHGRIEARFLVTCQPEEASIPGLGDLGEEVGSGPFFQDLTSIAFYVRKSTDKALCCWYPDFVSYHRKLPVGSAIAQAMVTTFKRVESGLRRLREAEGYVNCHADFLIRLARIFGAKVVIPAGDIEGPSAVSYVEVTSVGLHAQIQSWQAEQGGDNA